MSDELSKLERKCTSKPSLTSNAATGNSDKLTNLSNMDGNDLTNLRRSQVFLSINKRRRNRQHSNQSSHGGTEPSKHSAIYCGMKDSHDERHRNVLGDQTASVLKAEASESSSLLTVPSEQFVESARQRWQSLVSTSQLLTKPENRHIVQPVPRYIHSHVMEPLNLLPNTQHNFYQCSVANCPNNVYNAPNIYFFAFPSRSHLSHVWERRCGRKITLDRKCAKVCGIHFVSSDFYDYNERFPSNLKPGSIPSRYLNNTRKVNDKGKILILNGVDDSLLEAENGSFVRNSRMENREDDDEAIEVQVIEIDPPLPVQMRKQGNGTSEKQVLNKNIDPVFVPNEDAALVDAEAVVNVRSAQTSRKKVSEELLTGKGIPNAIKDPVLDLSVGADVKVNTKILVRKDRKAKNGISEDLVAKKQDPNVKNEHILKKEQVIENKANIENSTMESHENPFSARRKSELNSKEDFVPECGFDLNSNLSSWGTKNQRNKISALPVPAKEEQTRSCAKVKSVFELVDLEEKFKKVKVINLETEDEKEISTTVLQESIIPTYNPVCESGEDVVFLARQCCTGNLKTMISNRGKFSAGEMAGIKEQPISESNDEVVFLKKVEYYGSVRPSALRLGAEIQID